LIQIPASRQEFHWHRKRPHRVVYLTILMRYTKKHHRHHHHYYELCVNHPRTHLGLTTFSEYTPNENYSIINTWTTCIPVDTPGCPVSTVRSTSGKMTVRINVHHKSRCPKSVTTPGPHHIPDHLPVDTSRSQSRSQKKQSKSLSKCTCVHLS